MHVDDFVDDGFANDAETRYARFVLFCLRLPAVLQHDFREFLDVKNKPLFCTYEGKRYRVVMASRFGDIGITDNLNATAGYDVCVDVEKCSAWSATP